VSLSALSWVDLAVLSQLIGWWQLRFVQHDILEANVNAIPFRERHSIVAIEDCLRANIGKGMVDEARLSIATEEPVERVDVRSDGGLEGRIGRVILRRISKKFLTAHRVELMVPLCLGR
jgi:hypothetical protein